MKKLLTDRTLKALKPALAGKRNTLWDAGLADLVFGLPTVGRFRFTSCAGCRANHTPFAWGSASIRP